MSGRAFLGLLTGLAVATVSLGTWAAETTPPDQGNPEVLFGGLDKNRDGTIAAGEIPARVPESTKAFVQKADKNGDQKVSLEELREAFRAGPPPRPWLGDDGYERTGEVTPKVESPAQTSVAPRSPPSPRPERLRVPTQWSSLFKILDKNRDGSLNVEEFTAGMHEFFPPIGLRARLSRMEQRQTESPDWESEMDEELGIHRDEGIPKRPLVRGFWRILREWGPPPWYDSDWVWDEGQWDEESRSSPHEQPWWFGFIPPGPRGDRVRDLISTAVRQEVDRVFQARSETGRPGAELRQSKRETQPDLKK